MIHLDLQPEVEAQLAAEAQSCGIALDRYLQQIVDSRAEAPSQREQRFLDQPPKPMHAKASARASNSFIAVKAAPRKSSSTNCAESMPYLVRTMPAPSAT